MRIPKPSLTLLILIALLLHPAPLAHSVNMTIDVMTWAKSIKRRAERALHWATYAKTFFEVIKTYQIMRHEGQHILGVITALYDYNNSISLAPELTLTLTSSTTDPYLRFNDVNRWYTGASHVYPTPAFKSSAYTDAFNAIKKLTPDAPQLARSDTTVANWNDDNSANWITPDGAYTLAPETIEALTRYENAQAAMMTAAARTALVAQSARAALKINEERLKKLLEMLTPSEDTGLLKSGVPGGHTVTLDAEKAALQNINDHLETQNELLRCELEMQLHDNSANYTAVMVNYKTLTEILPQIEEAAIEQGLGHFDTTH